MICVCILCRLNRKCFWRSEGSNLRPLVNIQGIALIYYTTAALILVYASSTKVFSYNVGVVQPPASGT